MKKQLWWVLILIVAGVVALAVLNPRGKTLWRGLWPSKAPSSATVEKPSRPALRPFDAADYDRRLRRLAGLVDASTATAVAASTATSHHPWPAKAPRPKAGALLPFYRILAYYGNFRSTRMGILGELPEDEVLSRLRWEMERWNAADPQTPVVPALHYVVTTAQGAPGRDGKYRLRMPDSDIQRVIAMSDKIGAIVFLDIQVGKSTVPSEVPAYDEYLKRPYVHLGLDPEFSMKGNRKPGEKIGTLDAADINWAIQHLSQLVEAHHLPPKILVVHRFVASMLTNARHIKPTPQVQVVIDIDGWGAPARKQTTYRLCAYPDPVQFTGFKLFYKNDLKEEGSRLMTPHEVLSLKPQPIYVQYQ